MGYSDGVVELRDANGGVMYRYNTDSNQSVSILSSTGLTDGRRHSDLHIAAVTAGVLHSIRIDMYPLRKNATISSGEWGLLTTRAALSFVLEGQEVMEYEAGSVTYYAKGSGKYWLVGDVAGGVNLYAVNGTFITRNDLGKGPVVASERAGTQLYVAAGSVIGLYQPNRPFSPLCEEVISHPITSLLVDQNLIFAGYSSGDILAFDMKHTVGNEQVCKVIWRLSEPQQPVKLGGSRSALVVWTEQHSVFLHTNIFKELRSSSIHLPQAGSLFKTTKYQTGLLIFAIAESQLRVMEVLPTYRVVNSNWDISKYQSLM